jgi:myo-inositol-1(or 4)-monophosphatase
LRESEDDLALLISAAHAAGEIARRHFGDGPRFWDKGAGQGPVSEADLDVDAMLRARLLQARPDYGWLSEETADHPARLDRARVFIIDPIDGTRAFLEGQPGFAHVLAIVEEGVPVAAVVYLPMLGHTYSAARGQGAFLGGRRLQVSDASSLDGATVLAARPALAEANWPGGVPPVARHFRPSLAWRMALVAEGCFDAMLTLRPTWHWDIAAGALLIAEAGGVVSTARGAQLRFNTPDPVADGVIAAGAALHAALLRHRAPTQA